ncbi:hypothetical protein DL98DRAFT_508590 [Cadophora sp. DSE1049]|nr:hypothetical protein DL98DRAFT_508590 [Cadophora sp. DSE1049]
MAKQIKSNQEKRERATGILLAFPPVTSCSCSAPTSRQGAAREFRYMKHPSVHDMQPAGLSCPRSAVYLSWINYLDGWKTR